MKKEEIGFTKEVSDSLRRLFEREETRTSLYKRDASNPLQDRPKINPLLPVFYRLEFLELEIKGLRLLVENSLRHVKFDLDNEGAE